MKQDSLEEPFVPHVSEAEMRELDVDLDAVWLRVSGQLWATPVSPVERWAGQALGSPALARALITTPSLVLSWVLASVAIFALGVLVGTLTETPLVAFLAPPVAAVAVAFAYGAGADPAYEVTRTLPIPARMVLLARVAMVFVTNAAIGLVATMVAPDTAGITTRWLLPMVAISFLALAVATMTHSATLGGVAAVAVWGAILAMGEWRASSMEAVVRLEERPEMLVPLYLAMTVVCLAITLWLSGDGAKRRELSGWF